MLISQGRVSGLNSSQNGPVNVCLQGSFYEDTGILKIKVVEVIIAWVTYISLILLHLTYNYKIYVNSIF
jgi:hypothetical protein